MNLFYDASTTARRAPVANHFYRPKLDFPSPTPWRSIPCRAARACSTSAAPALHGRGAQDQGLPRGRHRPVPARGRGRARRLHPARSQRRHAAAGSRRVRLRAAACDVVRARRLARALRRRAGEAARFAPTSRSWWSTGNMPSSWPPEPAARALQLRQARPARSDPTRGCSPSRPCAGCSSRPASRSCRPRARRCRSRWRSAIPASRALLLAPQPAAYPAVPQLFAFQSFMIVGAASLPYLLQRAHATSPIRVDSVAAEYRSAVVARPHGHRHDRSR